MEPIVIVLAFVAGLLVRKVGYPPLLGYLVAGFTAHALGVGSGDALAPIADAGITLLLFTIGLKLNLRALAPRYVWGSAILHLLIAVPLTAAVILTIGMVYEPLALQQASAAWALAFALSFSSTVFAIKMFEERGESASFYASIAIGILVVQDVMAVIYLVLASGDYPTYWAIALLGLPLLKPLLARLFAVVGHGELLLLSGIMFALATAELFEWVHLKGGLGALAVGMLVASAHRDKAKELYEKLIGLKNLLLIGFFLQIGYYGFPSAGMLGVAAVLSLLIVLRPIIYFSLLTLFGLRVRTSLLTGLALFNYSEFGLIIAASAVQQGMFSSEWVTTLSLAMSFSFFTATPINKKAHELYRRFSAQLKRFEYRQRLPEETIGSLNGARVAVLGMGRVGCGAYATLRASGCERLVGVEENYALTQTLCERGLHCVHGDASDRDFWERTRLVNCELILVGLSNHRENVAIVKLAADLGYAHKLAVAVRFPDQKTELEELGCIVYYLYEGLGRDFALHALEQADLV